MALAKAPWLEERWLDWEHYVSMASVLGAVIRW